MVSTIVTTPGASSANSYVTLTEANQYFADRGNSADWLAETDDDILTRILLQAALDLELLDWASTKYDEDIDEDGNHEQALAFPRAEHIAENGLYIPTEIKRAQFEQALFLYRLNGKTIEAGENTAIKSFQRGGVSVVYRKERLVSSQVYNFLSDKALAFAKPFLSGKMSSVALVR